MDVFTSSVSSVTCMYCFFIARLLKYKFNSHVCRFDSVCTFIGTPTPTITII